MGEQTLVFAKVRPTVA